MSTTMYLRCVSHDPHISSDEVGHNTSFLPQIRSTILNRDIIVENMNALGEDRYELHSNDHRKRVLWWFLYSHPHCDIEIWDEYGQQYSLEDTVPEKPIGRDTVLGQIGRVDHTEDGIKVVFKNLTPEGERVFRRMML